MSIIFAERPQSGRHIHPRQISKRQFYAWGGLSQSDLFRKARKNGSWTYWML